MNRTVGKNHIINKNIFDFINISTTMYNGPTLIQTFSLTTYNCFCLMIEYVKLIYSEWITIRCTLPVEAFFQKTKNLGKLFF